MHHHWHIAISGDMFWVAMLNRKCQLLCHCRKRAAWAYDQKVVTKQVGDHLIDQRMLKKIMKLLSPVDQSPDALIGCIRTTISISNAVLDLACCFLTQRLFHDVHFSM